MKNIEVIDNLLAEVCLDDRIHDGIFNIDKLEHVNILREVAENLYGSDFANELYVMLSHNIIGEGNYPERQAYNKDGVLVTFPDAESKKAALKRCSHFESDPTEVVVKKLPILIVKKRMKILKNQICSLILKSLRIRLKKMILYSLGMKMNLILVSNPTEISQEIFTTCMTF